MNTTHSQTKKYNRSYVYFISLVAALGGLMFGFDLGIITGIVPYMQKIFVMAGIQLKEGLLNAVLVQLVFFFSTFIAIGLIDKIGRKILMLTGTELMANTLFLLALAFNSQAISGLYVLVLIMLYIAGFLFCLRYLPETKNKTLEQMKEVWQNRGY